MFSICFLWGTYVRRLHPRPRQCVHTIEAQNYMALITMIMMVPLLTMTFIPKDPNGTLARPHYPPIYGYLRKRR